MSSRCETIKEILNANIKNSHINYIKVINESFMHNVPKGSETHIKLILVSSFFDGLSRIERHRKINLLLKPEFEKGLHALSLKLYTEKEYEELQKDILESPHCEGSNSEGGNNQGAKNE